MYGVLKLHYLTKKTIPEHNGQKSALLNSLLFIYIIIDIIVYTNRYRNLEGILERFSFECRKTKTKTKVITLAITKNTDNTVNQSKHEVITCS